MQKSLTRLKTYTIDEVMPHIIIVGHDGDKSRQMFDGQLIRMSSLRLQTFKKYGIICIDCGIKGAFFAMERFRGALMLYHLNLYAYDDKGEEVLMTKDHIIPQSGGGRDILSNMQPMCSPCNCMKGNRIPKLRGN